MCTEHNAHRTVHHLSFSVLELLSISTDSVDKFVEQFVFSQELPSFNCLSFEAVLSGLEKHLPDVYLRNSQIETYIKYIICKNILSRAQPASTQTASVFPFDPSLLFASPEHPPSSASSSSPSNLFAAFLSANPPPPPASTFDRSVRRAIDRSSSALASCLAGEKELLPPPVALTRDFHFCEPSSFCCLVKRTAEGGGARKRRRIVEKEEEEDNNESEDEYNNRLQSRGNPKGGRTWISDALLDVIGTENQGKNRIFCVERVMQYCRDNDLIETGGNPAKPRIRLDKRLSQIFGNKTDHLPCAKGLLAKRLKPHARAYNRL
eukprot:GHVS01105495.1.p1 GENE.GHVS01105495.1~~GHVS01105495.1.p1  ORF type:complete len:321 (+),score=70.80 GHVS01105495.1:135-1097(+)